MIQRFDELTEPPVKGRYYMVWTVHGHWCGHVGWWPVWGIKHEDKKWIGFEREHYHLNRFFVSKSDAALAVTKPLHRQDGWNHGTIELSAPVLRRRVCRHKEAEAFPVHRALASKSWAGMFQFFSGTQCVRRNGWVCPHRGFDLGPIAPDSDGHITCPLHGLLINAATGVVAEHKAIPA